MDLARLESLVHVLAMLHAYPPHHNAGAELTAHTMLRHLAARGHRVDVLVSQPVEGARAADVYELDGVSVWVNHGTGGPFRWFGTHDQPDVVVSHLENVQRAAALADIHGVPMVHLVHNTHAFTKGALRRGPTQLAVYNSDWMRHDIEAAGVTPHSIVVHPPVTAADYATTHGKNITLINLTEAKGGEVFWRLAQALPDKAFLGVRGGYGIQVDEWVPDPGNVRLLSHQTPARMREVYQNTKILLMPSSYESYGRTAIEAAVSGIPTIAHPTPGLVEALGEAGTFVDRTDPPGWIAAVKHLSSPRGFSAASKKAKALAASLDTDADLHRFSDAIEQVVARGISR